MSIQHVGRAWQAFQRPMVRSLLGLLDRCRRAAAGELGAGASLCGTPFGVERRPMLGSTMSSTLQSTGIGSAVAYELTRAANSGTAC